MAITHFFRDSRDSYGCGWYGFIENGQLVIGYDAPREGGVHYRGNYMGASRVLAELKKEDTVLYNDIEKYFIKHGVPDVPDVTIKEKTSSPAGVLWKVQLFMDNGHTHFCQVRGLSESSVIKKLTPPVPEFITVQDFDANIMAIDSKKISVIQFLGD